MRLARWVALGLFPLVAACADPAPTTGSLIVQIDGLPAGSMGKVTVYGPNSFKQVLAATMTLQNLAPGSYVISPGIVSFANALYRSGPSLTKNVTAGNTENATISYALGSGSINLSVTGLPDDVTPQMVLSGPVARTIHAAGLIDQLPAGTYTLTTDTLAAGSGDLWAAPQRQRTLELAPSFTPVDLEVHYDVASGSLSLTVAGLPDSTGTPVTITGPYGFRRMAGASAEYTGLTPGTYAVSAAPMNICPDRYTPSAADQTVDVTLGKTGSVSVAYARKVAAPEDLNLSIDAMYLVQAVQDIDGTVPLVAGRPALLRVFGRANQCNSVTPTVRVTLSSGEVYDLTLPADETSVTTDIDEGWPTRSWNVLIPGERVQPGLSMVAEIDPDGAISEANEADNRFPATGARSPDINVMPIVGLRFVPVAIAGVTGRVSLPRVDSLLSLGFKLHPVSGYDVEVRAPYSSTHAALARDDVNGWGAVLSELEALRVADSSRRFYHGIVRVSYSSGIAGVAYIGGRTGLSWDYLPTGAEVVAHELAHNFGRMHSPCGGPGGVDPAYPFADGRTGAFGYDGTDGSFKAPTATDIMGYCSNKWISAYTYAKLASSLARLQSFPLVAASEATEPALLVWGRIDNGMPALEPAYEITTRPTLPAAPGPYRLVALDDRGNEIVALSFDANRIEDLPGDHRAFALAIPLRMLQGRTLTSLRLAGPGQAVVSMRTAPPGSPPTAIATRLGQRTARVQWDAQRFPGVLIRNAATGEILSFARGGDATVATDGAELEVTFSNRVRSAGRVLVRLK